METINITKVKANFSRLVGQAAKGEAFIIAKRGKLVVKVVPRDDTRQDTSRRFGFMAGQLVVPDDFDSMCADGIVRLFEGE